MIKGTYEEGARVMIIRLAEKNAVGIDKTTGVYKYYPQSPKSDSVKYEVDSFVERVFDGSAYDMLAAVVQGGSLSDEEKKALCKLLEENA